MRNSFTVSYLDVGAAASLPVRVPVVSWGRGEPILSILCGVHGDETSGLFAVRRLMEQLRTTKRFAGTIRIVLSANPLAQAVQMRVTPIGFGNLNRTGRGRRTGDLTERLAYALFEFLSDSTMVIDLHEFEMETPAMGVYIEGASGEMGRSIINHIAAFAPSWVWVVPDDTTSLVGALMEAGVPGFGVEGSPALLMDEEAIDRIAEGLYRVAQCMKIVEGASWTAPPVTAYNTTMVRADGAGIWKPTSSVLDRVACGDEIGHLIPFPLTDEKAVSAPCSGTLVQLARRSLVSTGTRVAAVGAVNQKVTGVLRSLAV